MGKIKDIILGTGAELSAANNHRVDMEQKGLENAGLIIDAYFRGTDPINGNELSEEFKAALAPIALSTLSDEIETQARIRAGMRI